MASITEALVVGAVALLIIYVSRILFKQQRLSLPPGPTPLPIIGSLHLLGRYPHRSLVDLAKKYGPVMSLQLGQRLCVVATSPDAAKEFLKLQDANFSSRPPMRCGELILPHDIGLHDITPVRRHLRKILVSELMSAKRLEASKYIRTDEIAYMLRKISEAGTAPIQVKSHLSIMSNNILSRMAFSKRIFGEGEESASLIQEFREIVDELSYCSTAIHLQDFFNVPTWFDPQGLDKRFRKLRARMDAFYTNVVGDHMKERSRNPISDERDKSLLDVLLDQLDIPETGVTDGHVNGVVWESITVQDLLSAGTDTTVLTSEWTMAEVLRNPALVKEARAELDRVVGVERIVQESDLPQLTYIQAIAKEALRLHPPVPLLIPHQSINPTKSFGYDIPAKVRLFVNVWAIGRDPGIWEKPLEFVPERFLAGAPHSATELQGQHFELTPFGSGRRACPGMAFAPIVVHLQVANLLHAFDWSLPDELMAPGKLDMTEGVPGMTLWKRDPLVAMARPRLPIHLY